ncbi:MAG: hypothetical protein R8K49_07865 [Mariprofundaceae bacterium]
MLSKITQFIEPRHFGLLALCALAFLYMALFRYDTYGIEEGAARALLINWSIIDQVANATPLFGIPDLRAIMFIFLDIHWAGSLPAAKVFTLFILFSTALMLYRWAEAYDNSESATMATALLLIAPISIMQVDSISPGVFLLFCFASAFWLEKVYRNSTRTVAGSFFMIIVMCAFAVSLHPMGLALPAALLLLWLPKQDAVHNVKRRNMLIGLGLSCTVILLVRFGWPGLENQTDYLANLGIILTGSPILQASPPTGQGLIIASLLGLVIALYIYQRSFEPMSLMLVLACLFGMFNPDSSWALMALACILFLGLPMLVAAHRKTGIQSLLGQRGLVLLLLIVCVSIFTSADKHYREVSQLKLKTDTDYLLTSAANIAKQHPSDFIIASQWPARTMLATKRDVLPLPPQRILEDAKNFMEKTRGITHFIFNPNIPENQILSKTAASLGHQMQAIELLPAGVILQVNPEKK